LRPGNDDLLRGIVTGDGHSAAPGNPPNPIEAEPGCRDHSSGGGSGRHFHRAGSNRDSMETVLKGNRLSSYQGAEFANPVPCEVCERVIGAPICDLTCDEHSRLREAEWESSQWTSGNNLDFPA
jgi:hypothetical protein